MPEEDELWKPDEHETDENTWKRISNVLEEIWKTDDTCLSPFRFALLDLRLPVCEAEERYIFSLSPDVSMTGHADIMRACFYGASSSPFCLLCSSQLTLPIFCSHRPPRLPYQHRPARPSGRSSCQDLSAPTERPLDRLR